MNNIWGRQKKSKPCKTTIGMAIWVSGTLGFFCNVQAGGVPCSELTSMAFQDTAVTSAEIVLADADAGIPEYCKVKATLTPRPDSEINMEVWLPTSGWNGYYHTAANSGWAGALRYDDLTAALKTGFATAGTDTGHVGDYPGAWCFNDDKLLDYGGRAIHETTLVAKEITQKFYGRKLKGAIMTGCSLGGLQTMKAIQDHPDDFDAVVAGSPHMFMTRYNAAQIWPEWLNSQDSEKAIPEEAWAWIHSAVLEQCDGVVDGFLDGIVDDPLTCDFDPYSLVCEEGQTEECLTGKQALYVQEIYDGPVYQDTGKSINPGPLKGAMADMSAFVPPSLKPFFFNLHKWLYFARKCYLDCVAEGGGSDVCAADCAPAASPFAPSPYHVSDMTFTDDIRWVDENIATIIDADNPDLRPFFSHGGKLMMYIGTGEFSNYSAHLSYFQKVRKIVGPETFDKSVRLFVVPGMAHCGGGECAADTFPKLETIVIWHETGKAPDVLPAAHLDDEGEVVFTVPLCAYPMTARYKGAGDPDKASSFVCEPYNTYYFRPASSPYRARGDHRGSEK